MRGLVVLALLAPAAPLEAPSFNGIELDEWLRDAQGGLPSNEQLLAFVPQPLNPVFPDAEERLSIVGAIQRLRSGNLSVEHVRERHVSAETLAAASELKRGLARFWALGGVARDLPAALAHFEAGAAAGDPDAMFMAGLMYATGVLGAVERDVARGVLYYSLAAESGSLEAQTALGHRYVLGLGVAPDANAAHAYYAAAGDTMLERLAAQPPFRRESGNYWAFGAESGTGLYGPRVYRRVTSRTHSSIGTGPKSDAMRFVTAAFRDEFESLGEALDTLYYRAVEEQDTAAMYALARVYTYPIEEQPPEYALSIKFLRMCLRHRPELGPGAPAVPQAMHAMCTEYLAEKYLFGDQGLAANLTKAKLLYERAEEILEALPLEYPRCRSCWSGRMLADMQTDPDRYTLDLDAVHTYASELSVAEDYTLLMLAADVQVARDRVPLAAELLRKVLVDTGGRAPAAALLLAQIDVPERQLERSVRGMTCAAEHYTPTRFAHTSYAEGDLESAALAFLVSGELGVPSSPLNLADMLDVRHSALGHSLARRWPALTPLTQWPVPAFIKNRERLAFESFAHAALQSSVDALAKVVEYAMDDPTLLPPAQLEAYLASLAKYNLGMAFWMLSRRAFSRKDYVATYLWTQRAVICPDVWVPVKVLQLLCLWHAYSLPALLRQGATRVYAQRDVLLVIALGLLALYNYRAARARAR